MGFVTKVFEIEVYVVDPCTLSALKCKMQLSKVILMKIIRRIKLEFRGSRVKRMTCLLKAYSAGDWLAG